MARQTTPIPEKGFYYNDKTHKYYLDGVAMTGITTALGVAGDKTNLIQWAANLAAAEAFNMAHNNTGDVAALTEAINSYKKLDTRAANEVDKKFPIFKEARTKHLRVRDTAADTGTDAHKLCELYELQQPAVEVPQASKERARVYIDWYRQNVTKTHFVERPLFSRTLFVGGTPDGGFQMTDGRNLINDKKFKPYIYDPSPFWQMAAYRLMLEEMASDTTTPMRIEWSDGRVEQHASPADYLASIGTVKWDGAVVVRVGERKDDLEAIYCDTYEEDKEGFLAALTLYRQIGAFKNRTLTVE